MADFISVQSNTDGDDTPVYVSYYLADLSEHKDGPSLRKKDFIYDCVSTVIVNSVKESENMDSENTQDDWEMVEDVKSDYSKKIDDSFVYRSVVYSKETQKPLCMAPPRSINFDAFIHTPGLTKESVYIDEIVEGTMINLFFEPTTQKWMIATKNRVGGNHFFYRTNYQTDWDELQYKFQYTFAEMFMEALGFTYSANLNDVIESYDLLKNCCYSFVLQHPMNHIVLPNMTPKVYLVQVYEIIQNIALAVPISTFQGWNCWKQKRVCFPKSFAIDPTIDDIYGKLDEIYQEYTTSMDETIRDQYFIGWMVRNMENGDRCSIRCPGYEFLKSIRGNHPNLQYQFLTLQHEMRTGLFLRYFPNYTTLFNYFNHVYWEFIVQLHQAYLSYYVKKLDVPISKKYFPLVYRLHHEIYLPSLNQVSADGEIIPPTIMNRYQVQKYVFQMNPKQLFYYLNYNESVDTNPVEPV